MKKLLSLLIICVFLCSCGQKTQKFDATVENINAVLQQNNLPFITQNLINEDEDTTDNETAYYCLLNDKDDGSKTRAMLNFYCKDDICNKVAFINLSLTENFENDLAIIDLMCDFYGINGQKTINKIKTSIEKKENCSYSESGLLQVKFEHDGCIVDMQFSIVEDKNNYSVNLFKLIRLTITDKTAYNNEQNKVQRETQKIYTENPYLYTDKTLQYPAAPVDEDIDNMFSALNIPFTAEFDKETSSAYGFKTYEYKISVDGQLCADMQILHYPAGKGVSFSYGNGNQYYYTNDSASKYAVETVCGMFDIENYAEHILNEINASEYNPEGGLYIKCGDLYVNGIFIYNTEENKVIIDSINLYEADVFKGKLISIKRNDSYAQRLYEKYFG